MTYVNKKIARAPLPQEYEEKKENLYKFLYKNIWCIFRCIYNCFVNQSIYWYQDDMQ